MAATQTREAAPIMSLGSQMQSAGQSMAAPLVTKDELIEFSIRTGAPAEVTENLQELEDDGAPYESIEEIWPDFPTEEDYLWNEDEY